MLLSAPKKPSGKSKLLAGCCLKQAGAQSVGDKLSLRPNSHEIKEQRGLRKERLAEEERTETIQRSNDR